MWVRRCAPALAEGKIPFIALLFAFLGPLGNLCVPRFFPTPFRIFYLVLPFFPLFFRGFWRREVRYVILFLPFFSYALFSGYVSEFQELRDGTYPLLRSCLFVSEALFALGMGLSFSEDGLCGRLMRLYLYAFFLSLVVGYVLYIGFYHYGIPLSTLQRFSVETQFGYGMLRFSPGSYPNEYGVVSSFALSLLIALIAEGKARHHCKIPRWMLYLFYLPTWLALILSTTRAAYLSLSLSLLYLLCVSRATRRTLVFLLLPPYGLLVLVKAKYRDLFATIASAIETMSFSTGSSGLRVAEWVEGMRAFDRSVFWGRGWGSAIDVHNVYLQILYEVGIIGTLLLLVPLFFYLLENLRYIRSLFFNGGDPRERFSHRIIAIGSLHILSFALTNHNLNHHLTWFIFSLFHAKGLLYASKERPFGKEGAH